MIDVRGYTISPYLTNALRTSGNTMYLADHVNGEATRNFVYPSKEIALTRLATIAAKDGTTDVFVSPAKKTVVMCGSSTNAAPTFVLFDAVLGVPEGNIAMYDGSSSQWNNYNTARLGLAYPTASTTQRNAWTFNLYTSPVNPNALTKNRAQGAFTAAITSAVSIWNSFFPVLGPTSLDMNQIENIDKAYMSPVTTTTSGTSTGGGTPGGC